MPLTPSQELAASVRDRALLVSAAAGSGKTRVLVERLMRYVDDGANIDEFLVITYTRAAAAELRHRILRELNQRLSADPSNRRLRRQTELCCRAGIGTIDSICGRLLRENVHLSSLPPDFRVVEEERSEAMKRAALDALLDTEYEKLESDEALRALIDSVGAGRDDERLAALVLRLYDSLRSHPDPDAWRESCRAALYPPAEGDAAETPGGAYLLSLARGRADYWAGRLEDVLSVLALPEHEALRAAYGEGFAAAAEALRDLSRACGQGWDKAAACFPLPLKVKAFRKEDDYKPSAKAVWDGCRKACEKLQSELSAPSAQLLGELRATAPAMEALLRLTQELERVYSAEKRRQGVVDFSDQEHMVLRLLEDEENGVRAALAQRWREVMVDEYQDVNACQDRLFAALSDGGRRLFLVGDVKQSIYRFRLADPGIFLDKYARFSPVEETAGSEEGGRILLRENFRSSRSVIESTNRVFGAILSRTLGELDYDEGARLIAGRDGAQDDFRTELNILDLPEAAEGEERPDKMALEAGMVASQIRALVDAGTLLPDGAGGQRPASYGDFAILLRSHKLPGAHYRAALARQGIPSVSQTGGGFFRSLEVTTALSLLSVIDNPRQDIPLIAVLRSPLWGFTPDELAAVRARDKTSDFYTALRAAGAEDERCAAFLAELERYRALSSELTAAALLGQICARGNLFALLSALPDGAARRENLQVLTDYARQYEQSGYRGLGGFVRWMKRLAERGEEPRTGEVARGDAVQIMSIHRSKGLEYPIVFLCGTARRFNTGDLKSDVLAHPQLGLGARFTDTQRSVKYPTLAWRAVAARLRRESLSEEMRVLYVAMTRARERLYLSCAWSKAEEKLQKLREGLTAPIAPELLEGDNSVSLWLARCALAVPDSLLLRVRRIEEFAPGAAAAQEAPAGAQSAPLHLAEKLSWRYAHAGAETLPSKLTASALKAGELPDGDAARPAESPPAARMPDFARAGRSLTGAERGTAVHLALQFIDFARVGTLQDIEYELQRLWQEERLTPAQAQAVDPQTLLDFFRSPLGRRLLSADAVLREQRFTLLADASGYAAVPPGDEILLQGIVDCCLREGGTLTVLDYKTDFVTRDTLNERVRHYTPQLRTYAMAMERIHGLPVKEGLLYFLALGESVRVALGGE